MRPIDADALKDAFCMFCKALESHEVDCKGDCMTHDIIDDEPTIDAVEVVRCEDCHWVDIGENICEKWVYCTLHRRDTGRNEYCSYGKRKDGEQNAEEI